MSNTQIIKSYIEKNFIFIIILFGLLIRLSALLPLKDIITNLADSFIYYDMAKNSYNGLGPKIDFIYSYMNMPKDITHIEDYYEPLFGLINSLFLYLGNGSFYSSLYISFFGGVISIPLTYIYSNILFNDKRISLLSAFFIASMPLMINRSIILMKESFVTCLYLILFIYFKKNIKSHNKYFYISLGIFSCLLGLVQYESIPILIISFSIFFLITRKIKEFFYFFLGYIPILAIYSFIFYNLTGLYTSTKYLFFFTSYQASDFSTHRALDINIFIKKFSKSFLYIYFTTLTNISLSIIFMFFLSIKYLSKSLITQFNAIFIIIHLLIHGIAVDLWSQDYIILFPIIMSYISYFIYRLNDKIKEKNINNNLLIVNILLYNILYEIFTYFNISNEILYYPVLRTHIFIPLFFSLSLVFILKKYIILLDEKKMYFLNSLTILCIVINYNNTFSYNEIYTLDNDINSILQIKTQAEIIKNTIPKNSIVLTDETHRFHYFLDMRTLRTTSNIKIMKEIKSKYKPNYAYTQNLDVLDKAGYSYKIKFKYNNKFLLEIT